jgi:hypothetical protein
LNEFALLEQYTTVIAKHLLKVFKALKRLISDRLSQDGCVAKIFVSTIDSSLLGKFSGLSYCIYYALIFCNTTPLAGPYQPVMTTLPEEVEATKA